MSNGFENIVAKQPEALAEKPPELKFEPVAPKEKPRKANLHKISRLSAIVLHVVPSAKERNIWLSIPKALTANHRGMLTSAPDRFFRVLWKNDADHAYLAFQPDKSGESANGTVIKLVQVASTEGKTAGFRFQLNMLAPRLKELPYIREVMGLGPYSLELFFPALKKYVGERDVWYVDLFEPEKIVIKDETSPRS